MTAQMKPLLNEALRLLRVFHGTQQAKLASELAISRSYLSEIESGKKEPSLDLLYRYADHFSMPLSSLLLFSEEITDSHARRPERLRNVAAGKVIKILQWIEARSENDDGEAA
ncbi:helix-turn-helix transcriptional regulator [Arhodomonas aquaeolei]|uniref:helix-turn-helix transcriptional regulator n=1 Tax=Arhodomonas aquaeolei TaxID=2369 RepID=UPI0035B5D4B9